MSSSHLSDEAVAACADGVLAGHARARATKHLGECAECARAVREQREAAWALRAAPAPALPTGLLDKLRTVPDTTPISTLPTAIGPDGSTVLLNVGTVAAFVPGATGTADPGTAERHGHLRRPIVATAAVLAIAGALTAGSVVHHAAEPTAPGERVAHSGGGLGQPAAPGGNAIPLSVVTHVGR